MVLLDVYVSMCFCTVIVIILIAMTLRESHGMRVMTTLRLAVVAGAVWPLLAFAVFQTGGVLVLAKGLGLVRRQPKGRALPPVGAPVSGDSSTGLDAALDLTA
jgi:hypothetical protein